MMYFPSSTRQILLLSIPVLILSMSLDITAQYPRRDASSLKPQATTPDVRFASGQSALKIPIELSKNIILLQAQVNDSRPLWFILDTGAN